ncbi:hypothetical protein [Medicago sativa virus 1]|nr:hypothetical protein [Medicago sativa virus 1]
MDPNNISEIVEFHENDIVELQMPSKTNTYRLAGSTTKIAHTQLDVRDIICNGKFNINALKVWKTTPQSVCVKEIRLEWSPHVELNHVAFMNVKIHNIFTAGARGKKQDVFFEGMFPIHVHWAVAVSSPRWISVQKYLCYSPWSHTITANNIPQEALEKAGEMTVSYVIEKGYKGKESSWEAPCITMDPVPFPYMIPFYKYKSPGGLYESNMSLIKGMIKNVKSALIKIGINSTISDDTIWAMSNTINTSLQGQIAKMEAGKPGSSLEIIEKVIQLLLQDKSPGYPSYDHIISMSGDAIGALLSKEISGIGEEVGVSSRCLLKP